MHIRALFTYSDNCRAVLREILTQHEDVVKSEFRTESRFSSIHGLLAHVIGAEERWVEYRIGGREVVSYEERAADSVEAMFADWDRIRAKTHAFLDTLDEGALRRTLHVQLGSRTSGQVWDGDLTIEQILFHIVNHETHHRAQISMALQQRMIDPPNFDYILLHG